MPISGGPGIPGDVDDGAWPLPVWPLLVVLDGRELWLREPDPGELLRALSHQNWWWFMPGLLDLTDALWVDMRLGDGDDPLDLAELSAMGRWIAGHLCRMPWWAACTLAATARVSWTSLSGRVAVKGGSLSGLPPAELLAAVWALLATGRDQESFDKLQAQVFEPRPADVQFAALVDPDAMDAMEAQWAAEAAEAFAGMDGILSFT